MTDACQLNLLLLEMFIHCWSNWWDFLWLHYSFSASLDLVARLPSIIIALIAALTSLSVLMSTGILISFSGVKHLVKIRSFKGLQSAGVRLVVIDQSRWSHLLPRRFLRLLQCFFGAYVTTTVATDFYRLMLITRSISMMVVLGANMVF
jgi:hypothetical protein